MFFFIQWPPTKIHKCLLGTVVRLRHIIQYLQYVTLNHSDAFFAGLWYAVFLWKLMKTHLQQNVTSALHPIVAHNAVRFLQKVNSFGILGRSRRQWIPLMFFLVIIAIEEFFRSHYWYFLLGIQVNSSGTAHSHLEIRKFLRIDVLDLVHSTSTS